MTSTLGIKKIQYPNGTNSITIDSSGSAAITTANITTAAITTANVTNATATGTITTPSINGGQIGGRRNIIINGAMQVAQRGTSSTATTGYLTADRFRIYNGGVGTLTTTQENSNGVSGVSKYSFKVASTNTASLASGTDAWIRYVIETKDIENLALTDSTENFTVSFYVKCSDTGQSSVSVASGNFSAAQYVSAYTIASANTWQRVTVTFPGNSLLSNVSGDFGLRLYWDLGAGTNYQTSSTDQWTTAGDYASSGNIQITGANGRYLQITGVQLEVGSQATAFEHRSFGEELALCQRYFFQLNGIGNEYATMGAGAMYQAAMYLGAFQLPVAMRTRPSFSLNNSLSSTNFSVVTAGQVKAISGVTPTGDNQHLRINAAITSNGTVGDGAYVQLQSGYSVLWDSEL